MDWMGPKARTPTILSILSIPVCALHSAFRNPHSALLRRLRQFAVVSACLLVASVLLFALLWVLFPFPLDRLDALRASTQVFAADGQLIRGYIADDDAWCFPLDYDSFSPWLIQATVAVEDGRFWEHPGVDGKAVARAAWQNLTHLRTVSGASTLTMQVVRLMDHRPRTVWSKAVESFRALQLERRRTKREILAAYLNRAPYGSNLRGAEAAARRYFGRPAADLTLAEAALLAGLPQSPARFRPDRHLDRARVRQRFVLAEMRRRGMIGEDQLAAALAQPLAVGFHPLPLRAPHLCDLVRNRDSQDGQDRPPGTESNHPVYPVHPCSRLVFTTIDLRVQDLVERALRGQVARERERGVTNGAAVVIENRTGAVRALVGSIDYRDTNAGRVNAALSLRSPGSTLKPFTYALAFDGGLTTPATVLADVPVRYAGYDPQNFDREFRGPVPAGAALAESLNIPALDLAQRLTVPRLRQFLADAGLSTLTRPPNQYGLSLALGAADVRLLELTNAYAGLARLGDFFPYRCEAASRTDGLALSPAASQPADSRRLLSPGAAYLIAQCLGDRARLERALGVAQCRTMPTVAWKTGTSTGRRDAWTFAYNPEYTVGVWLGDFGGRASPALVGADLAAPVAFEVFQGLYRDRPGPWYQAPPDVGTREVCPASGEPAGPDCPAHRPMPYLIGRSPQRTCSVHRRLLVDAESGHGLCPFCSAGRRTRWAAATVYPPALARWLAAHGQAPPAVPMHDPRCTAVAAAGSRLAGTLAILTPADGQAFVFLRDRPAADQQIELRAAAPTDAGGLFWFADGQLVARTAPSASLRWPLAPGRHELRCLDTLGRSASVRITVD
jgi:penicillin-binding protein 1C